MAQEDAKQKVGLILSGGGARAAYQVGVLMAIADIAPNDAHNPFAVICGTSAGAINATALAANAGHYRTAVRGLERIWGNLSADQIYYTDTLHILKSIGRALWSSFFAGKSNAKVSILDNTPLRRLLKTVINFNKIQQSIDAGDLHALSLSASGYTSGESVNFYQGDDDVKPWRRSRRIGIKAELGLDHMMASSAIPMVFPAVKINREYFGDGAIRQLAPLSPALHLGANKILVVGVSGNGSNTPPRGSTPLYPSTAQIVGHMLNSAFIDSFEGDVERLERINNTLENIPDEVLKAGNINLKPIELLNISPSQPLDEIAAHHIHELPKSLRLFLRGSGATNKNGASLLSYLLFEQGFCRALMALGYADAIGRRDEIRDFLFDS